jgi:GNAT superfamily N-acetyltransferase
MTLHGTPPRSIVIRHFAPADAPHVRVHLEETWRATYGEEVDPTELEKDFAELRATPDLAAYLLGAGARLMVAADAAAVVATICFREAEDVNYISGMYVRPTLQRRGLGAQLLEVAVAELPSLKPVVLFAQKHRTGVVAFYERQGLVSVDEFTEDFLGTPMPVVKMRRDLATARRTSLVEAN